MSITRRQALAASIGAMMLTGCKANQSTYGSRPGVAWPDGYPARPTPGTGHRIIAAPPTHAVPDPVAAPQPTGVRAIARNQWSTGGPVQAQINPMNGIRKITIHHEGSRVISFTGQRDTADHLDKVRKSHVNGNGWADIGYHYIVDRAGRVWEGRPIRYQGAHVRRNNENNVGVMVLGNFDRQSPSQQQLNALFDTVKRLKQQHRITARDIKSHQEINATACPGRNLQRHMEALRRYVG